MGGGAVLDAYKQHQSQMTNKHFNPQWEHNPKNPTKEEFYAKVAKKHKPEDLEAILAIEDELWNS